LSLAAGAAAGAQAPKAKAATMINDAKVTIFLNILPPKLFTDFCQLQKFAQISQIMSPPLKPV
jgi:hypothetical protein